MWKRIKYLEEFYMEFQAYAKAKKGLQNRKKEDCPASCIRSFEMKEKIIKDFENKYLTNNK